MRSELTPYEQIDAYMAGTLSGNEKMAFENQLAISPDLQEQLDFQMMMTRTVKRAALREEILLVSAGSAGSAGGSTGGAGGASLFKGPWIWGGLIVGLAALAYFVFASPSDNDTGNSMKQNNQQVLASNNSTSQSISDSDSAEQSTIDINNVTERIPYLDLRNVPVHHSIDLTTFPDIDTSSFPILGEGSSRAASTEDKEKEFRPWVEFDVQTSNIIGKQGGTIVGKQGTLIIVPPNAFIDEHDGIITGEVQVELIEALNWEDMFVYNLTTLSDGRSLHSGGMLNISAKHEGKEVKISPERPLYIEIPTDDYDTEMMAWEGEETDGAVNWKNPKKLNSFLTQVNLADLDFLPEGFVDYLELQMPLKGQNDVTQPFADSMYYSLSEWFSPSLNDFFMGRSEPTASRRKSKLKPMEFFKSSDLKRNPLKNFEATCMIDPASIRSIKTEHFQRSFVATKEFELRLRAMHKMIYGQSYLNVYMKNTDKDLYIADSLCALVAKRAENSDEQVFLDFYSQKATKIENTIYSVNLAEHYQNERKAALEKYNRKRTSREAILDEMSALEKARSQGTDPTPLNATTSPTYSFSWAGSSWINIDNYLHLMDKGSYDVNIQLGHEDFSGVIYQSIGYLNTAINLLYFDNAAVAKFPLEGSPESLSMQKSYCIGIEKLKDGKIRYSALKYDPYSVETIVMRWDTISQDQLRTRLRSISPHADRIQEEYITKQRILTRKLEQEEKLSRRTKKDFTAKNKRRKDNNIFWKLMRYVDNCLESDAIAPEGQPFELPIPVGTSDPG